jgi:hypothetical protein
MKRTSGRSRIKLAKAESISRLVLALRTWICSPMTRAAGSTSLNVISVFGIGWVDEHSNTSGCGHQLAQEFEPLCYQLSRENIDTCQVAAWPGKVGDKTEPDRIVGNYEDDGDRRGCRLGRQSRRVASGRGDDGDLPPNQLGRQRRQPIVSALRPAVLVRHVLTFDVPSLVQTAPKGGYHGSPRAGRLPVEESDHRHRRLLRARASP